MDGTFESGSTDPLLQIPSQLSAVLTLKRGGSGGTRESPRSRNLQVNASKDNSNRTPLLKRKRESIVWKKKFERKVACKLCVSVILIL